MKGDVGKPIPLLKTSTFFRVIEKGFGDRQRADWTENEGFQKVQRVVGTVGRMRVDIGRRQEEESRVVEMGL